ncbi:DUF1129 family protein [Alteribacter lacisalsi]|uniref:DUF1129 family protein n=1 Tax=Alteribacter lacisalsi TaxID=2045244 RepID=UPI001374FC53|nr:DUF1129 family protein [Alteribacter lacisalsi]
MNIHELIKQNRDRSKQLTGEHDVFYRELNVYINSSDADGKAAQELLSEIADHLIEAQREGKTPEDLYGKNPKMYARDLVEQLPKESLKVKMLTITYAGFFAAGILLALNGVLKLFLPFMFTASFLLLIPVLLIGGFATLLTLRLMKYSAFTRFKVPWLALLPQAVYMGILVWLLLDYRHLFTSYDPEWYIYLVTAAACAGIGLAVKARMPY